MKFYHAINPAFAPWKRQILRIMKITTFLLLISFLSVSAGTFAQKITLKEQQASLETVLNQIRQQSGFDIVYSDELLGKSKPVTINLKDATLDEALKNCLQNQPFTYDIEDGTVVIKELEVSVIDRVKKYLAEITVSGKVLDETGQALPGVNVTIKGFANGTSTDEKGFYRINAGSDQAIIVFSYVGYETQELRARDIANGSVITLKASVSNLREVVVSKGYYNEKRELSTGNVSTVSAKTIGQQPVSDPILALEGRVPGLQISQASGIPGASYSIMLRGQNSLANGNAPLFIIDGVPFSSNTLTSPYIGGGAVGSVNDLTNSPSTFNAGLSPFNNLNPADIESIEVLKDADATSIYGSRGANGVVLITTKKGKAGQTKVDVDLNSGIGNVTRQIQLLNTQQYLEMRHEAFKNDGLTPDPNLDYDVTGAWDTTRYTNWQKVLIGNTAHFSNANVSISGGNTNTQFVLGGGYSRQTTTFLGDFNDQKASVHLNLNHNSSNQKFHTQFSAQYVNDNNLLPTQDFTSFIFLAPDAPALYDPSGNVNFQNGTFVYQPAALALKTFSSKTENLISRLNVNYELLPGLKIQSNFGYTRTQMNQSNQVPATSTYGPPLAVNRGLSTSLSNTNNWIIEPQINYKKSFAKSKLDVLIGSTIEQDTYNSTAYTGVGFLNDALLSNLANAANVYLLGSGDASYRYNALYGRFNYTYDDKYIFNVTGRRDGSSRFGPGRQFGNFGAIGAAWIFSKEKFVEDALPFLSFGKFRTSYGTSGNDQITNYQYQSSYSSSGNYQGTTALAPTRLANPDFSWEVNKKLEAGIDLGFLSDRISLSASYYRNRSSNELVAKALPYIVGFNSIQANLPAVVQNTGLEIELNTKNIESSDFHWSTSFNMTVPRNKLVSFPGLANSGYQTTFAVGKSLFLRNLYHYTGVNPDNGSYTFLDVNNDGKLDVRNDQQLLTQVAQNFYGGLQNSFSFKGWQLDVFFQFVKQTGVNPFLANYATAGAFNSNVPIAALSRWQKPGDMSNIGKFSTTNAADPNFNLFSSDLTIVDASFIRLKNVSLSYSLPVRWQQAIRLQNARIYLQAQNLLTFTGYKGLDPETQSGTLPPLRMVSLGIHASF